MAPAYSQARVIYRILQVADSFISTNVHLVTKALGILIHHRFVDDGLVLFILYCGLSKSKSKISVSQWALGSLISEEDV